MTLGIYLNLVTGGICPGVHTIMDVSDPRTNDHGIGGACFVCQFRDECLGVEWGVCMGIY